MKLDILAIAAHPDDVELSCSGTLIKHSLAGQAVGVLDMTQSELSTRGSVELRNKEAQNAGVVMGLKVRMNAGMADGFFRNDEEHQKLLIKYIRHFRPEIVLGNALSDRHPDHSRAGRLIADACYYSGLQKIQTEWEGKEQEAWRPKRVYHYIQDRFLEPDFIVDITSVFDKKMEAINCYSSQFFNPTSDEPLTYIATGVFMDQIKAKDLLFGKRIGTRYGEGFISENTPGVSSLSDLLLPQVP
jgi:N-acetylglucosamine malate deacetylase 1